jgi:hypothetical protein
MATSKLLYGSKTNITITLASLATGSARASTAVDNSTNLYIDAILAGFITGNSSGVTGTGNLTIYAIGSLDSGLTYSDAATGTDGAHTINDNAPVLGVVSLNSNGERAEFGPYSIASAFGGFLPERWGIIIKNSTGAALNSTGGNHEIHYRGVHVQTA